jgi:hypothetical protein
VAEEQKTPEGTWDDVGRQFQALGESLAQTFRAAWESEQNRENLQEMKVGLESIATSIGQAIDAAAASPEGQKMQQEVEKAADSAIRAGEKAVEDARPHLAAALDQINAELGKVIQRLESSGEDSSL